MGGRGAMGSHLGARARRRQAPLRPRLRPLREDLLPQGRAARIAGAGAGPARHDSHPRSGDREATCRRSLRADERAPRTLREYRRWARSGGHFDYWRNRSIHAVGPLSSREYLKWLRLRNVNGKTAWNVVAGFRAFLGWLVEVEQLTARISETRGLRDVR